jgi:hypothetical protein
MKYDVTTRQGHRLVYQVPPGERMTRGSGPAVDLEVNLYTDEQDLPQPLFLAPFGRKNF